MTSRKGIPNKKGRPALIETKCDSCGDAFLRYRSALKAKNFCSPECVSYDRAGHKNPRWTGGNRTWRGVGWRDIRQRVLDRDGHRCVKCGAVERLQVNHIVPFRTFDSEAEANQLGNLETLCLPCHRSADGALQGTEMAPPPYRRRTIFCADCGGEFWSQSGTARRCAKCSPRRVRR